MFCGWELVQATDLGALLGTGDEKGDASRAHGQAMVLKTFAAVDQLLKMAALSE